MTAEYTVALIIVLALAAYLITALIKPEDFT
ncbi:MAG: K(+)-transporting ATPase subunit F [Methylococcus sp.]|nr:K(+)-transporting ATPase subunit F [Methylococcus sp.]